MTRTTRIQLRAEPERKERIRGAARLVNQSINSFVLDAATQRADEILRAATTTTVSADFFDALYRDLAEPPAPGSALMRTAGRKRRVTQARQRSTFTSEESGENGQ